MASALANFWFWWAAVLDETAGRFAPWPLRRRAGFTLTVSAETATIELPENAANPAEIQTFALAGLDERLAQLRKPDRLAAWTIRLAAGRFVLRRLSPLALPASRLQSAARLDLSASTPFKADQVMALPVAGAGAGSAYAIVKTDILGPLLSAFHEQGMAVCGLDFDLPEATASLAPEARHILAGPRPAWRRWLPLAAAGTLALAFGATGIHAHQRGSAAISQLAGQVEALGNDAKTARNALENRASALAQMTALRKSVQDSLPVTAIWEELARVLPDTAHVTDLSIKGGQVQLAGYADQAAALMVALERSPMFSKAAFNAPVTKTPGLEGERFEISLEAGE